jgi:predicted dehydrogenase
MAGKIRVGVIGAKAKGTWSARAHLPALRSHPDFELTAVCTTRSDTAEEARAAFGARLAFDDYRKMAASPEIDAVAVVVRVPSHAEPVKAALAAGKHVYCEWPLARNTEEAVTLTGLAEAKGVVTAVGLQARRHPTLLYMKELLDGGYAGTIMAVHVSLITDGILSKPPSRLWQWDAGAGANTLTIANGHTLDALRFVAGEIGSVSALLSTEAKEWLDASSGKTVAVNSPDNVLASGRLENGAVFSLHVAAIPEFGSGYRFEVYGSEGTLIASGPESPQMSEVFLSGAKRGGTLQPLPVPERIAGSDHGRPFSEAINVGRVYSLFAEAIRGGKSRQPTFATAVDLHRLLDVLRQSSEGGLVIAGPRVGNG